MENRSHASSDDLQYSEIQKQNEAEDIIVLHIPDDIVNCRSLLGTMVIA